MDVIDDMSLPSVIPTESSPLPLPVSDLTIDIIHAEILSKLPPKSLMRFKTVCKYFDAIISSPEFIRLHLRHSLSSNSRLLVTNGSDHTINMYDLNSHSSAPSVTFRWPTYTTSVVGSCNGLLLLKINYDIGRLLPLALVNPFTRTYIEFQTTDPDIVKGYIGFGFDECSNDYKVVVVSGMNKSYSDYRVTTVYSVNLKSWKVVDRAFTSDFMEEPYTRYNGVLVNDNLLHWIIVKRSDRKRRIGCFDIISETWQEDVLFPDHYYDPTRKGNFLDFGVLDGCLFTSFVNQIELFFDVWVMKEYGVHESWTKLLSINIGADLNGGVVPIANPFDESMIRKSKRGFTKAIAIPGGVIPVACRGIDQTEVLFRKRYDSYTLFWYNWKNNSISKPEIPNVYGHQPYFVKESLVRFPNAKQFDA
ncbi:F-box protein CPR1-like [Silene latifolia]|uniref:F-box protein CPR1-like n=1 Tax=Silene latifolia TaxID=37657 RepID=UPI003D7707CA